jgi:hypothetical protein
MNIPRALAKIDWPRVAEDMHTLGIIFHDALT